jgi:hypothetical protein
MLVAVNSCRCIRVAIPRFEYEIDAENNNRLLESRKGIAGQVGKERVASPGVLMLKYHDFVLKNNSKLGLK